MTTDTEYDNGMSHEVLSVRHYKAGYEVRTEICTIESDPSMPVTMKSAYNKNGDYIGNSKAAYQICQTRGIMPEPMNDKSHICSIGFCENEHKWYGWSHRAMYGFGIGDIVKEGDCTNSSGYIEEYIDQHPECDLSLPIGFEAKTLNDAKRMAIAFADSVG